MASWVDVQARLRQEYALDVDAEDEVALTLSRREGTATREQRVMVHRYEAWGRQMIEIRSAFGESGDYDATSLLTDNLNLPLGAVALHGRFLVLLHKACLDDISVEAALFLLTRVTLLADVLEGRAGKDRF